MNSQLKQASWEHVVIPLLMRERRPNAIDEPSQMPPDPVCLPWLIRPLKQCSPGPSWSGVLTAEPLMKPGVWSRGVNTNRRHKTSSLGLRRHGNERVLYHSEVPGGVTYDIFILCRFTAGCWACSWWIQGLFTVVASWPWRKANFLSDSSPFSFTLAVVTQISFSVKQTAGGGTCP